MSEAAESIKQSTTALDTVRRDFPALARRVHNEPLTYLDSAATSLTPEPVLEAMNHYYRHCNANIHRAVHAMGEQATELYEGARDKIREFLNASIREEIVFTRGTTEAINLVAQAYARPRLKAGDQILISQMEHHSNIVPWQLVCEQTGAELRITPMTPDGALDLEKFEDLLGAGVKLLALVHVSNSLGTVNPVKEMTRRAHERGIPVLIDGSQAVPHLPVDVQELDCDFYACTGHKACGPTGTGVLYGREELLDAMPPYHGGGDMILTVRFDKTTYKGLPHKFEAGTPNIAGIIGLGAAVDYLKEVGMNRIEAYEQELMSYAVDSLRQVDGLKFVGTASERTAVQSFVMDGIHPHDLGTILDHSGVAIRTGHHCTMPVMEFYGIPATARASFAFYNNRDDVDALVHALERAGEVLS